MNDSRDDQEDYVAEGDADKEEEEGNVNLSSEGSSSEEEDDAQNHYEEDGFVVNDDLEFEEEENEEMHRCRKRLRKGKRKQVQLDEEDYQLIQENMGMSFYNKKMSPHLKPLRLDTPDKELLAKVLFSDEYSKRDEDKSPKGQADREDDNRDDEFRSEEEEDFVVDDMDRPIRHKKAPKSAGAWGVSDIEQYREARDIYDYSEYLPQYEQGLDEYSDRGGEKPQDITELFKKRGFEPSLLEKHFLTTEDKVIRETDVPERLQLRFPNRPAMSDEDFKNEAKWIYDNVFLFGDTPNPHQAEKVIEKVENVLKFFLRDHFEVPFIARYEKESWMPELTREQLWTIYDWDEKWFYRESRKLSLKQLITGSANIESRESSVLLLRVDMSQNDETIDDIRNYFTLHYDSDLSSAGKSKYKRPGRNMLYADAKEAGLDKLLRLFGQMPSQLAKSLCDQESIEAANPARSPEEEVAEYVSVRFSSPQRVLEAIRHMYARELSAELYVRRTMKDIYYQVAVLSTEPLPAAEHVIDAFHPLREVKCLVDKPISSFRDDQFLQVLQGVEANLIKMNVRVPEAWVPEFVAKISRKFYVNKGDGKDPVENQWNEQRRLVIVEMLKSHLFPAFLDSALTNLRREAEEYVLGCCGRKLESMLMEGPYVPPENYAEWYRRIYSYKKEKVGAPIPIKVMVFCAEDDVGQYAVLDANGELVDALTASSFIRFEDRKQIESFINKHRPPVLVFGADGFRAYHNHNVLNDIIYSLSQRDGDFPPIQVMFKSSKVARIYQTSERAKHEFPDASLILRRAVSIGRSLLNPHVELCGLYEDQRGLRSLNLHPLCEMINPETLSNRLNRCFLDVVNMVGVDINRVVSHYWMRSLVPLVCGLGPRKSADLLAILDRVVIVENRMQLLNEQEFLGPCVWKNAIGFIKVARESSDDLDSLYEVLDGTRIFPDHYALARKIAKDAVRSKDEHVDYVAAVMKDPKKLDMIDINLFVRLLEERGQFKRYVLEDIMSELREPFAELREPCRPLSTEELFDLLTGDTLQPGMVQTVRVERVQRVSNPVSGHYMGEQLEVKLECGLPGTISAYDATDLQFNRLSDLFKRNDRIRAVIKTISKSNFCCTLTARESDLESHRYLLPRAVDSYLKEPPRYDASYQPCGRRMREQRQEEARAFIPRHTIHPNFQNIGLEEVKKYLEDKPPGFYLISPDGPDHLIITMKFYLKLFVHISVREEQKESPEMLGHELIIGNTTFSSLDDLIVNHMDPFWMNAVDMTQFKYFREVSKEEIERSIREEKSAQPSRIPYYITPSEKHPGRFLLVYAPTNNSVLSEYISLVPEGFRFRQKVHSTPDKLIIWFKKHFRDPIAANPNSSRGGKMDVPPHPAGRHGEPKGGDPGYRRPYPPAYPPVVPPHSYPYPSQGMGNRQHGDHFYNQQWSNSYSRISSIPDRYGQ
ncbi:transcription elongation factor SPT6-like [Schistocerca gregaria]|uniref:transcription elongation factor SPT6-like n=1 Tax=Schistocerca gregaria TaxID=7010 RepID=UPI00211E1316|nr:transcription elongation factor SPT6-like [Schistocerca gregaria]